MKTHKEIKKGLRWCGGIAQVIKGCDGGCPYYNEENNECQQEDLHADTLAMIQQLEAENTRRGEKIIQLYNTIEEMTKTIQTIAENSKATFQHIEAQVPKWISVKERPPENDDDVLIFTDQGMSIGYYDIYCDNWIDYICTNSSHVTHWMPPPELPKEE